MLDTMRSFTSTLAGKIFFSIVALSFVAFGGFTALGGLSVGDVSEVGSRSVTPNEFVRQISSYQNQYSRLLNRPVSFEEAIDLNFHQQAIRDLEENAALNALTDEYNMGISQQALVTRMQNDPSLGGPTTPALFASGLRDFISANGFTERTFEQFYRDGQLRDQLQQSFFAEFEMPKIGEETIVKALRNQRSIDYVRINALNIDAVAAPTEDEISAYLTENQAQLQRPALRSFDIITLSPQLIAQSLQISDAQLASEFETNKARFPDLPEQRAVQQLVITDAAIADQFRTGIDAGRDFTALVDELDLGSTLRNFGTVAATEILDEALREAAFGATQNSPVITTTDEGTSVILVSEITPARAQTLDDVRVELTQTLSIRLANSQINDMRSQIDNEIAAGKPLSDIATDNKLVAAQHTLDNNGRDLEGNSPLDAGDQGAIMQMVFGAPINQASPSILGAGANSYWVTVTKIEEQRDQTLEEARATIVQRMTTQREQLALETLAQQLVDEIRAGKTVSELATEKNYLAITSALFARNARPDELSVAVVQKAFSGDQNLADWAEAGQGDIIVFKIAEEVAGDALEDLTNFNEQLAGGLTGDVFSRFSSALRLDYGVSRNEGAIQAILTPQPAHGGHTGM